MKGGGGGEIQKARKSRYEEDFKETEGTKMKREEQRYPGGEEVLPNLTILLGIGKQQQYTAKS